MAGPNNPGSDDDDLLKDLENGSMNGGGSSDTSRPLPKKVELDIDDFLEEEVEEEQPPPPEEAPPPDIKEPEVQDKDEEPAAHKRFSKKKLIILGSFGFLFLAVLGLAALLLFKKEPPPPVEVKPAVTAMELKPFMVNFPPPDDVFILNLTLSVQFTNTLTLEDFQNNRLRQRDRIYRMIQALGPAAKTAWDAENERRNLSIELSNVRKDEPLRRKDISNKLKSAETLARQQQADMKDTLKRELTRIINETLRTGQVEKLDIIRMDMV